MTETYKHKTVIEIDADCDVDILLPLRIRREAITCNECGETFSRDAIRRQVEEKLKEKFFRCRLTQDAKDELFRYVASWFDKFKEHENICFNCGVE